MQGCVCGVRCDADVVSHMECVCGVRCNPSFSFVGFECNLLEFNLLAGVCSSFAGFECFLLEVNHSAGACVWGQALLLLLVLSVLCWRLIIVQECVCGVRCDGDVVSYIMEVE